jgi:hypothetical protein
MAVSLSKAKSRYPQGNYVSAQTIKEQGVKEALSSMLKLT